jgi:hypothetical protein
MTLAETLARFAALLHGEAPPQDRPFFAGRGVADSMRRLELYRFANSWKLTTSLGQRFQKTSELLGETLFAEATRAYFARPSAGQPIWSGWESLLEDFPPFLRSTAERWGRPDVADVALLDLAREEASRELEVDTAGPEAIARFTPAELGRVGLRFVPALRVLHLAHDVSDFWGLTAPDLPPPQPGPITLVVWRSGPEVFVSRLATCEAEALRRARDGAPLAEVLTAFQGVDEPAQRAHAALRAWLEDGLVAAVELQS